MTKFANIARAASMLAAATLVIAAAPQASVAAPSDPAKPAVKKDIKELSRTARKMVWCVAPKVAADTPEAEKPAKVCKTREAWIRDGQDPFGQY